jgi:hypothetical protein
LWPRRIAVATSTFVLGRWLSGGNLALANQGMVILVVEMTIRIIPVQIPAAISR